MLDIVVSEGEERQCIEADGFDVGSVAMGVGGVRLFGLFDVTDEEGNVTHTVPEIEIVAMERWDLKRGLITKPTEDLTQMRRIRVKSEAEKSEKMYDWSVSLANMVIRSDWMFRTHASLTDGGKRRLPVTVVESQCDMKKTAYAQTEMLQLQGITSAIVMCIDALKASQTEYKSSLPPPRINCQGMTKYGQRSDASRDRSERKEKAVEDLKELLTQLNTENSKKWLGWLLHMERIKEQIHDMCDAILMAIHKCEKLYEQSIKEDIQRKRALIKKIPYAPIRPRKVPKFKNQVDDPPSGEEVPQLEKKPKPKVVRKPKEKKEVVKKVTKRKRIVEDEASSEEKEPTKKKNRVYPMLLLDISAEET